VTFLVTRVVVLLSSSDSLTAKRFENKRVVAAHGPSEDI